MKVRHYQPLQYTKDSMSNEQAGDLYRSDRYIDHNPSLHEEDSPWKVTKILPLVDQFITLRSSKEINLLDVGAEPV